MAKSADRPATVNGFHDDITSLDIHQVGSVAKLAQRLYLSMNLLGHTNKDRVTRIYPGDQNEMHLDWDVVWHGKNNKGISK